MLTGRIRHISLAVLMAAAILVLCQSAVQAQTASGAGGSGGPFASVQCGQAWTPSCVVSAGSSGSSQPFAGTTGPRVGTASGGCTGTVSAQFGCVPPGCLVTVATLACLFRVQGLPGAGGPPPPGMLAQLAVRYLRLPDPVIRSSPAPGDLQLVYLPTWLWVSPAVWTPVSKTASVPGEQVTATATPVSVSWRMGDGSTVTCRGPGIPYSGSADPASASPDCGYTYTRSSAGQPGGAYHVTATIRWDIRWTALGGATGTLPPLFSAAAAAFRIAESQAVNTSGGEG